jgi:small subunit ribosomal protein S16
MAVVLRLMRAGAKKRPFYRIVAADSRRQRDGRFLEIVGHYDPMRSPAELMLEQDHIQRWIAKGATPSQQVASLLRSAGMTWGKPSAPKKKKVATTKPKRRAVKRKVSARKTGKKAARKAAKSKPAAPKPAKKAKS